VSERPVFDPHHDVLDRQLVDVNGTFAASSTRWSSRQRRKARC